MCGKMFKTKQTMVRIMSFRQGIKWRNYCRIVLIFFSANIKIRSERSPDQFKIISFEIRYPYNTLKMPQISKTQPRSENITIANIWNSTLNSSSYPCRNDMIQSLLCKVQLLLEGHKKWSFLLRHLLSKYQIK